ncbi:MAG: tryptophan--tRNA ligase [Elusimicrobiota bacterium]
MTLTKRVFSGIQPSGIVHIGNYAGALKNWVGMQETYDCLYCIVDLHAITVPQEPKDLKERILTTAAVTLAVGIDPQKSILFVQSDVPEHAELAWILNCFVYFGELSRMTQFKDKSESRGQGTSTGLFTYPALMAADILLYNTNAVPVGEDQKQHLELARTIARRINNIYPDLFIVPEPFIGKKGARIMGLDDPLIKMSKSAASEYNYISFSDSADEIRKKIKKAVTDSGTTIEFDEEKRPAISNLLTIYSAFSGKSIEDLVEQFKGKGYGDFKKDMAEMMVQAMAPIQEKIKMILSDKSQLEKFLTTGAERARDLASPKMKQIKQTLGLGRV